MASALDSRDWNLFEVRTARLVVIARIGEVVRYAGALPNDSEHFS
jgi:hypothetical protein